MMNYSGVKEYQFVSFGNYDQSIFNRNLFDGNKFHCLGNIASYICVKLFNFI